MGQFCEEGPQAIHDRKSSFACAKELHQFAHASFAANQS